MKKFGMFGLFVVGMFLASCTNVGPGYEAVVVNKAGAERSITSDNVKVGYVTHNPFTQTVTKYPNSINRVEWSGDEAVSFNAEGIRLSVGVAFSVRVVPGESYRVVQKYRNIPFERILNGYMRDIVANAFGVAASKRQLTPLLTTDLEAFRAEAQEAINDKLSPDGFEIQALSFTTNIVKPDAIQLQLDNILAAQNEAAAARQRVEVAKANAESLRQEAEGTADAQRITAQGEADAIRIQGEELARNPQVLQLRTVEKWGGVLPNVVGGDGTGLDLLIQPNLPRN